MGGIAEQNIWPEEIYRIQNTDPITGGQDGIINVQPGQMANRSVWLRERFLRGHAADGSHCLANADVADDAAIPEALLALAAPTAELRKSLDEAGKAVARLKAGAESVVGENGSLLESLVAIARLGWRYGIWRAEFEFFTDGFTMRDMANVDARGAVGRDDSIDCGNTGGFRPGMRLLLSDGVHREEVEIRSVLEQGRIRLCRDLSRTYGGSATLGYTDWDLSSPGMASAGCGQMYFSRITDALATCGRGLLLVCRSLGSGQVRVEYREIGEGSVWMEIPASRAEGCGACEGFGYEFYDISGTSIQLRLTGISENPAMIRHMALLPQPFSLMPSSLRTPAMRAPAPETEIWQDLFPVESSEFLTAYRDCYVQTEYGIFREGAASPLRVFDIRSRSLMVLEDMPDMPEAGFYELRCRHQSDMGEWSMWSAPVLINLKAARLLFGFANSAKSRGFGQAPFNRLGTYPVQFGFLGAPLSGGFDTEKIVFTTKLAD